MINDRFNSLAHWDNPTGDRYAVELEIVSVDISIKNVGYNFSSHVRDYDFSVLLLEHNKHQPQFSIPDNFGGLDGRLFLHFVKSAATKAISKCRR